MKTTFLTKAGLTVVLLLLTYGLANARETRVISPDGKLVVVISSENGLPTYQVIYKDIPFLRKSPLGLNTDIGDFTRDLSLDSTINLQKITDHYQLPNIKKSNVHYEASEGVFTFLKKGKAVFDVIFRVSNNDVAFRYKVYPQGERLACVIHQELTGFAMPDSTTTFLCPQSQTMVGFARTMPSYEMSYTPDAPTGQNGIGNGYTFPCLFRLNGTGWVLISETGVRSNYCGSRLIGHANGLYSIGFPMEGENNGNGTVTPGISLPGYTPWRTLTLGESLKPIVETTIPFDVLEPFYEASKKYEYGRGSWSWIIGMDESTNFEEQKRYIDFSEAMGYESVLVDALWDTQIGRDKIAELAQYGAGKNVALFLWYNSNGYWNDAPQSPRGIMDNPATRRKEMAWMKSIGIRGIKVDFFGGDKQVTLKLYEDILYDANDYGLLVIFHGCTLPRGWERMFPNYASSEAVRASENLHFAQENCDAEAFNACLHPFIRNTIGSMDFGGSTLNKYYNSKNSGEMWGGRRITSDVFALATAVLFQSGVQHFAMAPNNLTDAPKWAVDFMKDIPSLWDEVQFIDGYPGKYVVIARRNAGKWYVAGVSAQKGLLKLKLNLPMIQPGEECLQYADDETLSGKTTLMKMNKKQQLEVTIPENGGFVLVNE
ncbi:MAG: glycoside hydrolase family 97 catalytic domain-containing protein [Bacteroidales bacterium]|nr:glycoside hydrolase family 97 catalytic domain-containing protein [Bacteroidales bacterium]